MSSKLFFWFSIMFTVKDVIDIDGGDDMAVDDDTVGGCVSEVSRELFTTLSLECIAPNCTEMFINQSQLDDHLLHDHSIRAFRCLLKHCDRSFGSSHRFNKHLNKYHRNTSEWTCNECSKHYETYDRLTEHTVEKHHRGRFGCSVSECEFVGRRRSKVNRHYKREHQIDDNDSVVLIDDDDDKEDGDRGVSKPEKQQQLNDETQPDNDDQLCYITLSLECIAPNCSEMFVNQSQLDDHLFRVHSIKSFRCLVKDCARSFGSSRRLSKHISKAHSDVTEWHCGQCSKHYESYDRLTKHTIEKHHRGRFGCCVSECEFIGKRRSKVQTHYNREHQQQLEFNVSVTKGNVQDHCNVEWIVSNEESVDLGDNITKPTKRQRTDAVQSNQPKDESNKYYHITLSLKCHQTDCPQMFTNKSLLLDHMLQVHSIQRNQCLVKNCNKSFSDIQTLGDHIKQAHAPTTEWHCGQCPDRHYPTYKILNTHTINYHHLGQFQCSFSGCSYPIQSIRMNVTNHYCQEHKPDLICGQVGCGYRTYIASVLKRHERAHLGIRPYLCNWPQCCYTCTYSSDALKHIRNVHFNSKKTLLFLDEQDFGDPKDYMEVLYDLL